VEELLIGEVIQRDMPGRLTVPPFLESRPQKLSWPGLEARGTVCSFELYWEVLPSPSIGILGIHLKSTKTAASKSA
jgi:hypothetical protein